MDNLQEISEEILTLEVFISNAKQFIRKRMQDMENSLKFFAQNLKVNYF